MLSRARTLFLTGMVLAQLSGNALSQTYPAKPIRFIIPNAAGTGPDLVARVIGPEMGKSLGQPLIVDNRPSATSVVGYEAVAKAAPDGYTMGAIFVGELATMPLIVKEMRFDPFKDLLPVIGFGEGRVVVGSASSKPWKSIAEFAAAAKANPGKLNYGASAPSIRLPMEALIRALGVKVVSIPYSNGAQFLQAVVSGEVDIGFIADTFAIGYGEKFRTLAVSGTRRMPALAAAPTFIELGLPAIPSRTFGIAVPAGTPKAVIDKLHGAGSDSLKQPEVKAGFDKLHLDIEEKTAPEVTADLNSISRIMSDVAKNAGIVPE